MHLRDGDALRFTCTDMARYMGRAIVMPNLTPPVATVADAEAYYGRIMAAQTGAPRQFNPLMVLYLTDQTSTEDIAGTASSEHVHAVKLYPAGATTNSDAGVSQLDALYPVIASMEEHDVPLLIHGEVTDHHVDIFDRERVFIETQLAPIVARFPRLRVVLEHITTTDAVDFVGSAGANIAATITAHHLLYNRNHMLVGGIKPHFYCLPILKRNRHQEALIKAATGGSGKFFLGTDSAPHTTNDKESACGCAGCYTGHASIELYAEVFDEANALQELEAFASFYGPDFYRMPRNTDTITLRREPWEVPEDYAMGNDRLTPLRAGETVDWTVIA